MAGTFYDLFASWTFLTSFLGKNRGVVRIEGYLKMPLGTHVNFTHWIVTKDALPEAPDLQLLTNLWARHAAFQCSFNQESLGLLITTYSGDTTKDAVFDPAALSGIAIQIKYKIASDSGADDALRLIGISRDLCRPLPYLVLLTPSSHHYSR